MTAAFSLNFEALSIDCADPGALVRQSAIAS